LLNLRLLITSLASSNLSYCLWIIRSCNRHDITEILLKVALNTITLTHIYDINPAIIMQQMLC
jgi:hypothetical protein